MIEKDHLKIKKFEQPETENFGYHSIIISSRILFLSLWKFNFVIFQFP